MKYLAIILVFLAGCASAPKECLTSVSPGVSVESTNPNIPKVVVVPQTTVVCLTPGYVSVAKAASAP